ncbi:MAG TPA: glycosyltransferase family 1 protein [Kofleriaceae bacterium]|nr:glycosyltransferase family 1 protein [Kofleriaceae bacterium]
MRRGPRIAIVSDTVDDINGISLGLRRLVAAARRAGHEAHLVGAAKAGVVDEVVRISAAMTACLPIYPDMTWSVPELPPLTSWLSRNADIVQVATPGPMGIAGVIAARMLGLPVIAQYHTEVAEYAARMTGMPMVGALVQPIVAWFYRQADVCLAPSQAVAKRLASFGIAEDHVWRIRRGVDLDLFQPGRRDRSVLARWGIGDEPVALYVGRLSKEKNLEVLTAAWTIVRRERPTAKLLVVGGEGPLAGTFKAPGMIETGGLFDEDLAAVFASADVFAFPSETETFGNVVVEAAASGLPAIVAAAGASREHVVHGETGQIIDGRDVAQLAANIIDLFDDPAKRARMGEAARAHAASYDLGEAVRETWAIYDRVLAERAHVEAAS